MLSKARVGHDHRPVSCITAPRRSARMGKSAFKKRMRVLFQSLEGQVVLDYRMPDGSLFKGLEPWFVPYSSAQWAASDPWDIEVAAPRVAPRHTHTGTRSSSESQPHPPTPTTPSPAAATAPGPGHAETAQPSIVPQHGPDSPYALRAPTASVLEALYQRFVIHLNMSHWESRVVAVPPCPQVRGLAHCTQSAHSFVGHFSNQCTHAVRRK